MKDPLPLRWICCCYPCGAKKSESDPSELERGTPGDIELPLTTTKLEDDNAYIAEVAINMALRRSTETAARTSMESAVPVREIHPPPTYDSVWTQPPNERRMEREAAQSGPTAMDPSVEPEVAVASQGSVVRTEPRKPVPQPTPPAPVPRPIQQQRHDDEEEEEEDSDFESRISTPRTLTPPTTVPPTLADADEDEESRRWVRDDRGGMRRA